MKVVRVIPCLDVDKGRVVKGVNFAGLVDAGDPVALAAKYDQQGADELIFLDITASHEERDTTVEMARAVAEQVFIPFTIGGGIRTAGDARRLLRAGADKVSVNSAAVARPELISEIAEEFGSQCCVVAIDAKRTNTPGINSGYEIFVKGGREATGVDAIRWVERAVALGAGEIMVNSIDRDGTREGYDIEMTRAVADAVRVPIIASGGVGGVADLAAGVIDGGATAVLAAGIFHFGEATVADAKKALASAGLTVRPAEAWAATDMGEAR